MQVEELVITEPVEDSVVVEIPCDDKLGEGTYSIRLLRELHVNYALTPQKIAQLWAQAKQYDVLFSDYTAGKFEPFFWLLCDPRGIWLEISRAGNDAPSGIIYFTNLKPNFDVDAHIALWDRVARGREPVLLFVAEWIMDRFNLQRITAPVPGYQQGTRRLVERLGMQREGTKRNAVLYKGSWGPMIEFGLLRSELDEAIKRIW